MTVRVFVCKTKQTRSKSHSKIVLTRMTRSKLKRQRLKMPSLMIVLVDYRTITSQEYLRSGGRQASSKKALPGKSAHISSFVVMG